MVIRNNSQPVVYKYNKIVILSNTSLGKTTPKTETTNKELIIMDKVSKMYNEIFDDERSIADKKEIIATLVAMASGNADVHGRASRSEIARILYLALEHKNTFVRILVANGILELVKKGSIDPGRSIRDKV